MQNTTSLEKADYSEIDNKVQKKKSTEHQVVTASLFEVFSSLVIFFLI